MGVKFVGHSPCWMGVGQGVHYCVSVKFMGRNPCGMEVGGTISMSVLSWWVVDHVGWG